MTPLLIIWIVSLSTVLVLGGIGLRATGGAKTTLLHDGRPVREFFMHEAHQTAAFLGRVLLRVRPPLLYVLRAMLDVLSRVFARGKREVATRVFGKGAAPRGVASSFFLKNIAEGKGKDTMPPGQG